MIDKIPTPSAEEEPKNPVTISVCIAIITALFIVGSVAFLRSIAIPSATPMVDKEEIIRMHGTCTQEFFARDNDWHNAVWVCDQIFWKYKCTLYPLNTDCL